VVALGSSMDWAESESGQVTMNLQFAQRREGAITVTDEAGNLVFEFDPAQDPVLGAYDRGYQGAILSCPGFHQGDSYLVYQAGAQMGYTGTDVRMSPGGLPGGQRPPEGFDGEMPTGPEGMEPPEGFDGEMPAMSEGGFPGAPQDGGFREPPEEGGNFPQGGFGKGQDRPGETWVASTVFYMQDRVNFFSGLEKVKQ